MSDPFSEQRFSEYLTAQRISVQHRKRGVSMWSVLRCYKQETRLEVIQLIVSSIRESVKTGLEYVKLNHLHC
jgi:hypothetical protein